MNINPGKSGRLALAFALAFGSASVSGYAEEPQPAGAGKKGVMLLNRIGPSASELFIANADGSDEHPLFETSGFDFHPTFSADGRWIVFTSAG